MNLVTNKNIRIISNFISPESYSRTNYLDNYILETDAQGKIIEFHPAPRLFDKGGTIDLRKYIISTALIDGHAHVPQINSMGKYEPDLLSWLNKHIYPNEQYFNDHQLARQISNKFFAQARSTGTSTIVTYSSNSASATDEVFKSAIDNGLRIIAGNVMMDQNVPQALIGNPMSILTDSMSLCEKWHETNVFSSLQASTFGSNSQNSDVKENYTLNALPSSSYYAFTPRFAISCSEGLLQETAKLAKKYNAYIQTHLNESTREIKEALRLHSYAKSYTEIYKRNNLLGAKTLLAHCIHNSDEEINIIKDSESKIIHCPDSNLFLGSGRFEIERIMDAGITIGLGSDVGAGTTLDMFKVMKSMLYMQLAHEKKLDINIPYYLATLGNANALGLEDQIGSIEIGKQAELLIISLKNIDFGLKNNNSSEEILSRLIFTDDYTTKLIN